MPMCGGGQRAVGHVGQARPASAAAETDGCGGPSAPALRQLAPASWRRGPSGSSHPRETVFLHNAMRFACAACTAEFRHHDELAAHRRVAHRSVVFHDWFQSACACVALYRLRLDTHVHSHRCATSATAPAGTPAPQTHPTRDGQERKPTDAPVHAASRTRADGAPTQAPLSLARQEPPPRPCPSCRALLLDARTRRIHARVCAAAPHPRPSTPRTTTTTPATTTTTAQDHQDPRDAQHALVVGRDTRHAGHADQDENHHDHADDHDHDSDDQDDQDFFDAIAAIDDDERVLSDSDHDAEFFTALSSNSTTIVGAAPVTAAAIARATTVLLETDTVSLPETDMGSIPNRTQMGTAPFASPRKRSCTHLGYHGSDERSEKSLPL